MQDTPKGLRLHIGLFGRRNVGKSSLMNALVGQSVSIVSDLAGTTTDPVEKTLEMAPLGPIVFVDTAGLDDVGEVGEMRKQRSLQVLDRVDLGIVVATPEGLTDFERDVMALLTERKTPFLVVFNKCDLGVPPAECLADLDRDRIMYVQASATAAQAMDQIKEALFHLAPENPIDEPRLIGDMLSPGDTVVLVVPIDLGAPKGRLILPQVQTIRDVLDSDASCVVVKERELADTLAKMTVRPRIVVCDSQVVLKASADTPPEIPLTTFSILMSRFKGDMIRLAHGAGAINALQAGDRVLITESCSHHSLADDIGRVKIPRWLRQFAGGDLHTDVVAGKDFPSDLSPYSLVVQCGGCMVTRKMVLHRQYLAERQNVPMTNYGMAISQVQGVLERTLACFPAALEAFRRGASGE
ncbi:MAG: [FeFe] hydrogenase H-cluster maturation GTPase HydF [Paludibacterium sp.]|uniref:[FeFe] hydrogenase H-cluster maturation GTPase HydF n=1 Tax=Paludibacterium sp. TaxID=1917523 RepID=UPI0025F190A1|nr:[FeFe] hydrogenase H-cluster maturation GTPase HydF [Paludibacterium sp.]MBV8045817.1 [FeFe] hydrogenase H-cluster maturation GTPase HydF [Paludibacterium sp.]MBV8648649.1 [FeFe] hydrogenase H-cluster maturation GTPase HydF [Paludibacterium sp.]